MASPVATYRFGPYELRTRSRELYKHGTRLRLRPQSYQVLQLLVTRAGDAVAREEFRKLLWAAETVVDFELGLNTCIKELRGVLNDSASEPRYIETLPKLGYRVIVPVEVGEATGQLHEATAQPGPATSEELGPRVVPTDAAHSLRHRRWALPLGTLLLVLVTLAGYFQRSRLRDRSPQASGRVMLAVLPFANLTGDPGQEYFSDGLTEEMIGQLGRLDPQHLGVIGRTSVMQYKHSEAPLQKIGRVLGIQYVLEGSVRRDSNNVRISAQLIQMKDQTHVWARQYDREPGGLLSLQGEIAQEIADEIQLTLGDDRKWVAAARKATASPSSYEAYDLYLKGRYFWNKRTPEGFRQAAEYFQRAIGKDPNYAPAYAGLADTFGLMSTWSQVPQNEFMPKARTAALRALQMNESLAEAHASLALVAENYDYDWQTAEKEFRLAIQLEPSYATAHQWYAEYLSWQGRFDEALAESERARQLDPLSLIIATDHGAILYFSRQYDRAIEQLHTVLEMDPSLFRPYGLLIYAHVQQGRFAEALADIQNWRRFNDGPWTWAAEAYVCGRWGREAQARRALTTSIELFRHSQWDPTPHMLLAYVGMDRKDEAIAILQKAYAEHSNAVVDLKVEPNYDRLRSDSRFQDLQRRVRLAQ